MEKIYFKLFDILEIGDDFPTLIMGVINLSPESFYKGSIYENPEHIKINVKSIVKNGAKMIDLGARSTAPWSKKITTKEELKRLIPAMETVCKIISKDIIISLDTQYREVAEPIYDLSLKYKRKMIINDVSCLKTDNKLQNFIIEKDLPVILMASKKIPGDLCTIEEIINQFNKTIAELKLKGYDCKKIILDPGIGRWIEKKNYVYDLKIIGNLDKLRVFGLPILVALSRKSFIASVLGKYKDTPEKRYNGTLSATAISIYNGAHIVRTHDVNNQLIEISKIAQEIKRNH
ncbi:MAG: dihydropteroate synthase [Candidatus Lokiarchaeota archaeon]|nr:dihydropteroate synthase [Candidatus Lokiarchaeota archaeon]